MVLEYDPQYEQYCRELQIQEYLESDEFLDIINGDLQVIRNSEIEELI